MERDVAQMSCPRQPKPERVGPKPGPTLGGSLRKFARGTFAGRLLLIPVRLWNMLRWTMPPVWRGVVWVFGSREHYNYTYDLQARNLTHMAAFLSVVSGHPRPKLEQFIREIREDEQLRKHVLMLTANSQERYVADMEVRYGRRMGWYALVRAVKPQLIVETGVDKGLGSVVLAAALRRNAGEGRPGRLIGIDINPAAGYLLSGPYAETAKLMIGDSLKTLRELPAGVDFFIHDSDHNPEFEAAEYRAVEPKLTGNALVLSDNAEHTDELMKFASATSRNFLYFGEKPAHHWWPGEGIGIAYPPKTSVSC
jgi:predicted O-methyltransferase YrrM